MSKKSDVFVLPPELEKYRSLSGYKYWTKREEQILLNAWGVAPVSAIAEYLSKNGTRRSVAAVGLKAAALGLHVPR